MADPLSTLLASPPRSAPRSIQRFVVEVDYKDIDPRIIDEMHVFVDEPLLGPLAKLLEAGFFPAERPGPRRASQRTSRTGYTGRYEVEADGISRNAVTAVLRHILHTWHVPAEVYERGRRELEEMSETDVQGPRRDWKEHIAALRIVSMDGTGSVPVADWGRYDVPSAVPGWVERATLTAPVPPEATLNQEMEFAFLDLFMNPFKPLDRIDEPEIGNEPEIWIGDDRLRAESWTAEAVGFAEIVGVVTGTMPGEVPVTVEDDG